MSEPNEVSSTSRAYRCNAGLWHNWLLKAHSGEVQVQNDARAQTVLEWIRSQLPELTWDGLVRIQEQAEGRQQYAILETVEYFVNEVLVGAYGYKNNIVIALRSFFRWNRAQLPEDSRFVQTMKPYRANSQRTPSVIL